MTLALAVLQDPDTPTFPRKPSIDLYSKVKKLSNSSVSFQPLDGEVAAHSLNSDFVSIYELTQGAGRGSQAAPGQEQGAKEQGPGGRGQGPGARVRQHGLALPSMALDFSPQRQLSVGRSMALPLSVFSREFGPIDGLEQEQGQEQEQEQEQEEEQEEQEVQEEQTPAPTRESEVSEEPVPK